VALTLHAVKTQIQRINSLGPQGGSRRNMAKPDGFGGKFGFAQKWHSLPFSIFFLRAYCPAKHR